ncbi:MAG: hypothetical protein AMXMBFR46_18110 [Acidimicrobiia bacterium]
MQPSRHPHATPVPRVATAQAAAHRLSSAPAISGPVAVNPEDASRRARFEQHCQRAGLEVSFVGSRPRLLAPQLHRPADARPWIVAPLDQDPVVTRDGRIAVPGPLHAKLRDLAGQWSEPVAIVLAHELAEGPIPTHPILARTLLDAPAEPVTIAEASAQINATTGTPAALRRVAATERVAATAVQAARRAGRGAAFASAAVIAAPFTLVAGIDPIVFALVPTQSGSALPAWFEIARWEV